VKGSLQSFLSSVKWINNKINFQSFTFFIIFSPFTYYMLTN
jgi:hypothetical protein